MNKIQKLEIHSTFKLDLIFKELSKNTSIEVLILSLDSNYQIEDESCFDFLEINKTIKKLSFGTVCFSEIHEKRILEKIASNDSIEELELTLNNFDFLIENKAIKSLKFTPRSESSFGGFVNLNTKSLANALSHNRSLTHLGIHSSSNFDKNLMEVLLNHSSIISYNISNIFL